MMRGNDAARCQASARQNFHADRAWQLQANVADPARDDRSPAGTTTDPSGPGWGARRQLDLRRVRVYTAGGALRVAVQTNQVSTLWNPANGFVHLTFTVFVEPTGHGAEGTPASPGAQVSVDRAPNEVEFTIAAVAQEKGRSPQ